LAPALCCSATLTSTCARELLLQTHCAAMSVRTMFYVWAWTLLPVTVLLVAIGCWGSSLSDFDGWKVHRICGPIWICAQTMYLASGLLHDVAFIRLAVVLGNVFISAWVIFGCAHWPHVWNSALAAVQVDQIFWCTLVCLVNAVPMLRQFKFDDSTKAFDVGKYEAWAETVWRERWRRSGVPRMDFKTIVEAGGFLELPAGARLLTREAVEVSESDSDSESPRDGEDREQDAFYYVVAGALHCRPARGSGIKDFRVQAGQFLDAFVLLAALGQTSVCCQAMFTGPTEAVVPSNSQNGPTIVIKWSSQAIDRIRFAHGTFAPQCLRNVVSSAVMESLFRARVADEFLDVYDSTKERHMQLAREPLAKSAAVLERSLWQQLKMSFVSPRDLWDPSGHQRTVNAVQTGSHELALHALLKDQRDELVALKRAARPSAR